MAFIGNYWFLWSLIGFLSLVFAIISIKINWGKNKKAIKFLVGAILEGNKDVDDDEFKEKGKSLIRPAIYIVVTFFVTWGIVAVSWLLFLTSLVVNLIEFIKA